MKKIVVLGGGFGGLYTARYLERFIGKKEDVELILVNRDNYFVYQPMLPEIVGGSLGPLDTVSPLRRLLKRTKLYFNEIDSIDTDTKTITLIPKFTHTPITLTYDHLVVGLGTVTDFRGTPGLHEHALPFKNLADAIVIRNQVIDAVEAAATTDDMELRKKLLTFVVGGGGFSGAEVVAEVNDFARALAKKYHTLCEREVRVVMVHSKERLMERELSESLAEYAADILRKHGVEILFKTHLVGASPQEAILSDGQRIPSKTIISTVPASPNPLMETINLPKERGKLLVDSHLQVKESDCVWAIGDCALIPQLLEEEGFCPPTAQFAIREAKVLAHNIAATLHDKPLKQFKFKALGMIGALGHHCAVAELFGKFKFSSYTAWLLWRFVYWLKLPGASRKIKVGISWLLDMLIPAESAQLRLTPSQGITQLHYESGEIIFHEGDIGDYLYIIISGRVEVSQGEGDEKKVLSTLSKGEFFGEMALLNQKGRVATVTCLEQTDVLALKKSDFGALVANFTELRTKFEETERLRSKNLHS